MGSVSATCAETNSGTIKIFRNGDDCCADCTINVVASPQVTGGAKVNPTASVDISSSISIGVGGMGASASGGVSLSNSDGGTRTINGVPYTIPAGKLKQLYAATAQPPLDYDFETCSLSITIATAGVLSANASQSLIELGRAEASGNFEKATPGLTITATTNCDDSESDDGVFHY